MHLAHAYRFLPAAAAFAGVLLIAHWLLMTHSAVSLARRVPLEDSSAQSAATVVDLKGFFQKGDGVAGPAGSAWPGFRGALRDNIDAEGISLNTGWGLNGPARLWQIEVGEGYAGPAVFGGRVYLLDYDQASHADVLRCLSAADGREIWRRGYHIDISRNHGISRTVCAVAEGCVVTLGPKCQVLCVDAVSGDLKWGLDLVRDFGATVPPWYAGQNPLIDRGRVILAPGGKALLMAVDLSSGKPVWQTPNPNQWEMTHSSVTPVTFQGKTIYVYCASGGVVGVSAEDGRVEFELPQWKVSMANVPSPLPLPDDRILFTGGYGAGAMMVKLQGETGKIVPRVLLRLSPEVFGAEQHTPVFYRGYIYGILPVSSQLCCLSLDGKQMWVSGGHYRFGLGPFLIADGKILVLADAGTLNLIEASDGGFKPIATASLFEHGHEAWGPMALSGGRLFARDLTRLACFDLKAGAP